jgi:hypothetical protein
LARQCVPRKGLVESVIGQLKQPRQLLDQYGDLEAATNVASGNVVA